MKILIVSLNFKPELTGIGKYSGEMAEWFSNKDHQTKVICAPPYYPDWKVKEPYTGTKYTIEHEKNLEIIRCPVWVPKKLNGLNRLIHLMSFSTSSSIKIFQQIFWKPDIVIVVMPTFFLTPAALITAKLSKSISCLHIQDFEIDAAFKLNMIRGKRFQNMIYAMESRIMNLFDVVSTISFKMQEKLVDKGVKQEKTVVFPNWYDLNNINPYDKTNYFRTLLNIPEHATIALYSGNLGDKQGLNVIVNAAHVLKNIQNLYIILCGNGPEKDNLIKLSKGLDNIKFLNLQPNGKFEELLLTADIHLLPQRADVEDLVMPSKLTGMLASGRPVIATTNNSSEIANVLKNNGLITPPNSAEHLAEAILKLTNDKELRMTLGNNARKYCEANLDKASVLKSFKERLSTFKS